MPEFLSDAWGATNLLFKARKAGMACFSTELSAVCVGGLSGTLLLLPVLEAEEMEKWRGTAGRLLRKPCGSAADSGVAASVAFEGRAFRERKFLGNGI